MLYSGIAAERGGPLPRLCVGDLNSVQNGYRALYNKTNYIDNNDDDNDNDTTVMMIKATMRLGKDRNCNDENTDGGASNPRTLVCLLVYLGAPPATRLIIMQQS